MRDSRRVRVLRAEARAARECKERCRPFREAAPNARGRDRCGARRWCQRGTGGIRGARNRRTSSGEGPIPPSRRMRSIRRLRAASLRTPSRAASTVAASVLVPSTFRAFSALARSMTIEVLSSLDIFLAMLRYLTGRHRGRLLALPDRRRAAHLRLQVGLLPRAHSQSRPTSGRTPTQAVAGRRPHAGQKREVSGLSCPQAAQAIIR